MDLHSRAAGQWHLQCDLLLGWDKGLELAEVAQGRAHVGHDAQTALGQEPIVVVTGSDGGDVGVVAGS